MILDKIKLNKQKIIIFICLILIIIGAIYSSVSTNKNNTNETYEYWEEDTNIVLEEKEYSKRIVIHITGKVNKPGVIYLNEGSRIVDAIEEAGGETEDADLSKTNLAYILEDGEKIYIPSVKDEEEQLVQSSGTNKKVKININTAGINELQQIPGIGESTAEKIINYRSTYGKFKVAEDIKNVSGIGDSKYENIKEYIVVK